MESEFNQGAAYASSVSSRMVARAAGQKKETRERGDAIGQADIRAVHRCL